MDPKPIPARFITADPPDRRRQPEPEPRRADHSLDADEVTAGNCPEPRRDAEAGRHRELPFSFSELKCDVQNRFVYTHLRADCCDHLSPPGLEPRRSLLATARSHSLFVTSWLHRRRNRSSLCGFS